MHRLGVGNWILLLGVAWMVLPRPSAFAQAEPAIELDPELDCWFHGEHPTATAWLTPVSEIAHGRLYFRCSSFPDYYFVDLDFDGDSFSAVLPQASGDCPSVHYYLEAVTRDFVSSRTSEREAPVAGVQECREQNPLLVPFTGDARIVVGATTATAAQMAPGFSLSGVSGFISSAGLASSAGAGLSMGTVTIAGIGAAVAGGSVIATSGGSEAPGDEAPVSEPTASETEPSASGESSGPTTTTVPAAPAADPRPQACVITEPDPPVIEAGDSIRFDASCSKADREGTSDDEIVDYEWDLGDGRVRSGRVITPVFRDPGVYDVTLTVTDRGTASLLEIQSDERQDSRTFQLTVEEPNDPVTACFVLDPDPDPGTGCFVALDASCSTGAIVSYDWIVDDGFPVNLSGKLQQKDLGCTSGTNVAVTLTVTAADGRTDVAFQNAVVLYSRTAPRDTGEGTVDLELVSELSVEGTGAEGGVVRLNDAPVVSVPPGRSLRRLSARKGRNRILAGNLHEGETRGLWRIELRGLRGSGEPPRLQVLRGQVVSRGAGFVVFGLTGAPGEVVELEFLLER